MSTHPRPRIARRDLFRGGAALGLAGAGVTLAAPAAVANTGCTPVFRFDAATGNPVNEVPLHDPEWIVQTFSWDNTRDDMYFTQTQPGSDTNDLYIVRTDLTGKKTGHMALKGFGHGQGFTIEPTADGVLCWGERSKGAEIVRYPFVDGATLETDDPRVEDRTPDLPDITKYYPFHDAMYDRMWFWFLRGGKPRLVGFSMEDASAGRMGEAERIAECHAPNFDKNPLFQGFAVCGGWAYFLEGNPPPPGENHPDDNLPGYLSSWNIDRAASTSGAGDSTDPAYGVRRFQTQSADGLQHKEPEGMGLQIVDGRPKLGYGFASYSDTTTKPVKRQASVYTKDVFTTFSSGPLSC